MSGIADTPEPPYYAVIFTPIRDGDKDYTATNDLMMRLAAKQPGFLGIESAGTGDGFGITVSYWRNRANIAAWRNQADHALAQERGRGEWYATYRLRIAKVESDRNWRRNS